MMKKRFILSLCIFILVVYCPYVKAQDAQSIVEAAFNYMRDDSSISLVDMTIHRPDWKRTLKIRAWTKGQKNSIFRILAPPKDKGNGTLKKGKEMWMYNPKVNRIIKLPPSMMSQSWMGSDFSNNDLSKSDSLLTDYTHEITSVETLEGKKIYLISSTPKPDAPVIWGRQKLKIREDNIIVRQEFYDEDFALVKVMTAHQIKILGGKLYPEVWKMAIIDEEDKYTELHYKELIFGQDLPDDLFTIFNLKNPRR